MSLLTQDQTNIQRPEMDPRRSASVDALEELVNGIDSLSISGHHPFVCLCQSHGHPFDVFTSHFKEVFGLSTGSLSIPDQLMQQCQGSSSTSDYTLQSCTLAATSRWNETALLTAYRKGLDPSPDSYLQWHCGIGNCHASSHEDLSICLPLPARKNAIHRPHPLPVLQYQNWCRWIQLCLYCGPSGHYIKTCPSSPPHLAVSTLQFQPDISTLSLLTVQLLTPRHSVLVPALINSGSSGNYISHALLRHLKLPWRKKAQELRVKTIQGKLLRRLPDKYRSPPVTLHVGCFHRETISFLVLECLKHVIYILL